MCEVNYAGNTKLLRNKSSVHIGDIESPVTLFCPWWNSAIYRGIVCMINCVLFRFTDVKGSLYNYPKLTS